MRGKEEDAASIANNIDHGRGFPQLQENSNEETKTVEGSDSSTTVMDLLLLLENPVSPLLMRRERGLNLR